MTKTVIMKNGFWLTVRNIVNIIARSVGIFILLKIVQPDQYGMFSSIMFISAFVSNTLSGGLNIFVIKSSDDKYDKVIKNVTLLNLFITLTVVILSIVLSPLLSRLLKVNVKYVITMLVFSSLVIAGSTQLSMLERDMKYNITAIIDILSQLIYYLVSIPLVLILGLSGLVIGYVVMILFTFLAVCVCTRNYIINYLSSFDKEIFMSALKYFLTYTVSNVCWQTRNLIFPLVIVPMVKDKNLLGNIAAAIRIIDAAGILCEVWRKISINYLSLIKTNHQKFVSLMVKGTVYNSVFMYSVSLLFIYIFPSLMIYLLGAKWSLTAPFIASSSMYLMYRGLITIPAVALNINNKNILVAKLFLIQFILISITLFVFIKLIGPNGYHYAMLSYLVVGLLSYLIVLKQYKVSMLFFVVPLILIVSISIALTFNTNYIVFGILLVMGSLLFSYTYRTNSAFN